jgi:hypothetical protein
LNAPDKRDRDFAKTVVDLVAFSGDGSPGERFKVAEQVAHLIAGYVRGRNDELEQKLALCREAGLTQAAKLATLEAEIEEMRSVHMEGRELLATAIRSYVAMPFSSPEVREECEAMLARLAKNS